MAHPLQTKNELDDYSVNYAGWLFVWSLYCECCLTTRSAVIQNYRYSFCDKEWIKRLINDAMTFKLNRLIDWFFVFNATFSNIMATRFSGGRSRSTRREPTTMGKQLVNLTTYGCETMCTLFCYLQSRARTHTVLVIVLYELLGNPTT
jgi:hypothetical protein